MESSVVLENTSNYTVTGLSDSASYSVSVTITSADNKHKIVTSDSITVYGKSTYIIICMVNQGPSTCNIRCT